MTNSRVVPVGRSNPTVFVRTDHVISMEVIACRIESEEPRYQYVLKVHLEGGRSVDAFFDHQTSAAEAAVFLCNKINGVDS